MACPDWVREEVGRRNKVKQAAEDMTPDESGRIVGSLTETQARKALILLAEIDPKIFRVITSVADAGPSEVFRILKGLG